MSDSEQFSNRFELKFGTEVQSYSKNIYMLGEYGIYGQIRAIKGKYNQIGANKG